MKIRRKKWRKKKSHAGDNNGRRSRQGADESISFNHKLNYGKGISKRRQRLAKTYAAPEAVEKIQSVTEHGQELHELRAADDSGSENADGTLSILSSPLITINFNKENLIYDDVVTMR